MFEVAGHLRAKSLGRGDPRGLYVPLIDVVLDCPVDVLMEVKKVARSIQRIDKYLPSG